MEKNRSTDKFKLRWAKRRRIIQEMGGKCSHCDESDMFVLDCHHLNPLEKEYEISRIIKYKDWNIIKREILKCILLCRNCHSRLHLENVKKQYKEFENEIIQKSTELEYISKPSLNINEIIQLARTGKNINEISKKINKSISSIWSILKKHEIDSGEKLFLTKEEYNNKKKKIDKIKLEKYLKLGKSVEEIAKIFDCSKSTLYPVIKKNNLKITKKEI